MSSLFQHSVASSVASTTPPSYPRRATLNGLERKIFKLVSRSATPDQWAAWLRAPLEHAAAKGNLGLVEKLIGAGATVIAGWKGCRGQTLLHAAAVGGNEGVMSSLLRAGAQPDVNTLSSPPSSRSPLYLATMCGHEAVARLLVLVGADVNFNDPIDKCTVLHQAVRGGHERLVKELMIGGANVNARDWYRNSTPLHVAAEKGLNGIVSALLFKGVDIDAVDGNGCSALIYAAGAVVGGAHLAVVETLLAAGADSSIRCTSTEGETLSALDWAANGGHVAIIQALLLSGANVHYYSHDGEDYSALRWAALADQARSVDALIEAGADIELKETDGFTPLACAVLRSSSNALLALLQHGAVVNARDNEAMTPLHWACYFQKEGLEAIVDLLLRWGADETSLNDAHKTPADLLDVEHILRKCSQDEVDRVHLVLTHAPADRAWRRRCWLVMLRSRASKAGYASCDNACEGSEGSRISYGQTNQGRKVARSDGAASVASGVGGQATGSSGASFRAETEIFGSVVASLVGMEPEGVFRAVVSFL